MSGRRTGTGPDCPVVYCWNIFHKTKDNVLEYNDKEESDSCEFPEEQVVGSFRVPRKIFQILNTQYFSDFLFVSPSVTFRISQMVIVDIISQSVRRQSVKLTFRNQTVIYFETLTLILMLTLLLSLVFFSSASSSSSSSSSSSPFSSSSSSLSSSLSSSSSSFIPSSASSLSSFSSTSLSSKTSSSSEVSAADTTTSSSDMMIDIARYTEGGVRKVSDEGWGPGAAGVRESDPDLPGKVLSPEHPGKSGSECTMYTPTICFVTCTVSLVQSFGGMLQQD
eukprot:sb/3467947/